MSVFDDDNDEYGVLDTEFKQEQFFNNLQSKCIKRLSDKCVVVQSAFYSIYYKNKEIFIDSTNKNMQNVLYSLIKNKKLTCGHPVKHWINKFDLLSMFIVNHDNSNIKYVLSLLDSLDYNNV